MSPDEARQLLEARGLSVNRAADWLGVSRRMMRYYLSGQYKIPKAIQMCLRMKEAA